MPSDPGPPPRAPQPLPAPPSSDASSCATGKIAMATDGLSYSTRIDALGIQLTADAGTLAWWCSDEGWLFEANFD